VLSLTSGAHSRDPVARPGMTKIKCLTRFLDKRFNTQTQLRDLAARFAVFSS
jgi:hypothetical protein